MTREIIDDNGMSSHVQIRIGYVTKVPDEFL
jgi:hypothetical protein